jgi:HD-like signal output (HDOD) protein
MSGLSREERVASCVKDLTSRPGFPAFSRHIQKVLNAVDNSGMSAQQLTDLIIRDYSLTIRVLRAANSRNYSDRPILSVTLAVIRLGTEAVRHLASSILVFEHFHNKPAGVRELMMLSMLSANHVREIARLVGSVSPEEAYLCGMTRNLGEVLTAYYFPEEYAQILTLLSKQRQAQTACLEVLQFTFEDLGTAIARYWGMPDTIGICQQPWVSQTSERSQNQVLHAAVSLGNMLTTVVYRMGPEARADRLKACLREYSGILPLAPKDVEDILDKAIGETKESFEAMHVGINELRLREQTRTAMESMREVQADENTNSDIDAKSRLQAVEAEPEERASLGREPSEVTLERLTQEVCSRLDSSSNFGLETFILTVLEAIYRGAGFDRVLFAFANPERTHIEGRMGLGDDIDALIEKFRFRLSIRGGPVSVALLCKRPLVADVQDSSVNDITGIFGCSYLVLYPLLAIREVVGCLYMENRKPRPSLTAKELSLLEQLRDTLTIAIQRRP